jgi:hypothetical protein
MTDDLLQYFDAEGNSLSVGTRVKYFEAPDIGTVVSVEDPDEYMGKPSLTVRYDDGEEVTYTGRLTEQRYVGMDDNGDPANIEYEFEFEEIEIA